MKKLQFCIVVSLLLTLIGCEEASNAKNNDNANNSKKVELGVASDEVNNWDICYDKNLNDSCKDSVDQKLQNNQHINLADGFKLIAVNKKEPSTVMYSLPNDSYISSITSVIYQNLVESGYSFEYRQSDDIKSSSSNTEEQRIKNLNNLALVKGSKLLVAQELGLDQNEQNFDTIASNQENENIKKLVKVGILKNGEEMQSANSSDILAVTYKKIKENKRIIKTIALASEQDENFDVDEAAKSLLTVNSEDIKKQVAKPSVPTIGWLSNETDKEQITVSWDIWWGRTAKSWKIYVNGVSQNDDLISFSKNEPNSQSAEHVVNLENGVNDIEVRLYSSANGTGNNFSVAKKIVKKIDYNTNSDSNTNKNNNTNNTSAKQPGKPVLAWLPDTLNSQSEQIEVQDLKENRANGNEEIVGKIAKLKLDWNMWWGNKGNSYKIINNGSVVVNEKLSTYSTSQGSQKVADIYVPLIKGDNKLVASLCYDEICSNSIAKTVNYKDASESDKIATPPATAPEQPNKSGENNGENNNVNSKSNQASSKPLPGIASIKWSKQPTLKTYENYEINWIIWYGNSPKTWKVYLNNKLIDDVIINDSVGGKEGSKVIVNSLQAGDNLVRVDSCNEEDDCTKGVEKNIAYIPDESSSAVCYNAWPGVEVSELCKEYLNDNSNFGGPQGKSTDLNHGKEVIGYFTDWGIYGRDFQPADIPAGKLTAINYAFANIKPDGTVFIHDKYAAFTKHYPDTETWSGDSVTETNEKGIIKQLYLLKTKFPHLKLYLSVGGWTWSDNFYSIAADPVKRKRFATSSRILLETYGFDGLDIDWEFPVVGGEEKIGTPADTKNFTLLMKDLHDVLKPEQGTKYALTAAVSQSHAGITAIEYDEVKKYLDKINIMSYDYQGAFNKYTGHNAPLFTDNGAAKAGVSEPDPHFSIANSVYNVLARSVNKNRTDSDGLSNKSFNEGIKDKILLGAAFYGRSWSDVQAKPSVDRPMVPAINAGPGSYEAGVADYKDIGVGVDDLKTNITDGTEVSLKNLTGKFSGAYKYYWDDEAKAAYLYDDTAKKFISFTSPKAIHLQGCFAKQVGIKGVMFWELSGDDKDHTLLDNLNRGLSGTDCPASNEFKPGVIADDQKDEGGSTRPIIPDDKDDSTVTQPADLITFKDRKGNELSKGYDKSTAKVDKSVVQTKLDNLGFTKTTYDEWFPYADSAPEKYGYGGLLSYDELVEALRYFPQFANIDGKQNFNDDVAKKEIVAFLANTSHETTGGWGSYDVTDKDTFATRYTYGLYFGEEVGCETGTCSRYYSDAAWYPDSWKHSTNHYHGRGPVQLSWNYNYALMSERLGLYTEDGKLLLVENPEYVLKVPAIGWRSALWFWMTAQAPKPSPHEVMIGKWTPSQADIDNGRAKSYDTVKSSFGMTVNIINGGLECNAVSEKNKVRNRYGFYRVFSLKIGLADPKSTGENITCNADGKMTSY